jgi:hypothetical protein
MEKKSYLHSLSTKEASGLNAQTGQESSLFKELASELGPPNEST